MVHIPVTPFDPVLPPSTVENVIGALISGLHGRTLRASRKPLASVEAVANAASIPDALMPCLAFVGADTVLQVTEWDDSRDKVTATVPAILKVKASKAGGGPAMLRRAIDDLLFLLDSIRGLPVDADGKVYAFDPDETPALYDRGRIRYLANLGGPRMAVAALRDVPGTAYGEGSVSFQISFYKENLLDEGKVPLVNVVGLRVLDVEGAYAQIGFSVESPIDLDDYAARTHENTPAPELPGHVDELDLPPEPVAGFDYEQELASLLVSPAVLSLAVAGTSQLVVLAVYADESARTLPLAGVVWASSNAAVATVGATGVVAGVGAGSCTVTATFLGRTSNAVAVTVA